MFRPAATLCITIGLALCLVASSSHHTWAAPTQQPLHVVVTIPVLKDLVEQVGGPHVRVTSLLKGYENEHTYSPKPSDLLAVRKARLLFQIGLGLEVWVANLVKNAGGATLGVVTTSKDIPLIQDGAADAHGHEEGREQGNPHVWLDPQNAVTMLRHITEALMQADPTHAADYRLNQAQYVKQLDQLQQELVARLGTITDRRIVVHHAAWPYFAGRFGLQIAGTIHIQSGSEPSARHLQSLIGTIKNRRIKVIVSEIQLNQKLPSLLAKETGARVVVLTTLPGGIPHTETYLDMLRYNVFQLAQALEAG